MSVTIECATCAIQFCVPDRYIPDRRNDHRRFYCPSGHPHAYSGKTDLEKANEKIDRLLRTIARIEGRNVELRDQLDHTWSVAYGYKGAMRKYQREIRLVS